MFDSWGEPWGIVSSNDGLRGSGATGTGPPSSSLPGAGLENTRAWENGYRGMPTSRGCCWVVMRTISDISPWSNFSCRAREINVRTLSKAANVTTVTKQRTSDGRTFAVVGQGESCGIRISRGKLENVGEKKRVLGLT